MATEVKLPELGENLTGGDVSDVKVAPGDSVTQGQTLLEVEAEKSTVEVPSPLTGKIQQVLVKKGDAIKVGQALFLLEETGAAKADGVKKAPPPRKDDGNGMKDDTIPAAAPAVAPPPAVKAPAPAKPAADERAVPAGPATRRLARELGVDLARVRGTGPGGRATEEDVKAFVNEVVSNPVASSPGGAIAAPPLPDFSKWGEVEKRPLDSVRRKTAEQMSLAWSQIPHVTQHDLADITDLEAFRKEQGGKGPKLTVTAFALKAAAIALREFPQFNASLDQAAGQLIVKRYYHIGVAVDTERGLLVPVLRDVNTKRVRALAQELADVAEKARQKKLAPDDLRGGTFTITNLGGIGGTGFTPIINYPEVAILGLSRGRLQPVFQGDAVVPRLLLPLSLSYDHRVIDGAAAARFVRRVAEMLEQPLVMLLDA
jgi:pyruvate dehydrogenase E2 component (dihydrolipoamide acetyltransferase)